MSENAKGETNNINSGANILSFIVRVWMEEPDSEGRQKTWRGHITPIPDGKRHYFTDINEIPAFIAAYLKTVSFILFVDLIYLNINTI